jgi:ubiquitin C-terminal hydrolase
LIGLWVKNIERLEKSLELFWRRETLDGDNQYRTTSGRKLNVYRTQCLKTAPSVLVFQLKRFEYDVQSRTYCRLDSEFEFGQTVAFSNANYVLHGVVLHAGQLSSGHYTSLVRIGDRWLLFNDSSVEPISESDFENAAFGRSHTAAYLLFYIRVGAEIDGVQVMGHFDLHFPGLANIEKDNDRYLLQECLYSIPFVELVLQHAELC